MLDHTSEVCDTMLPVPVKRSRKPKKQTEKEILREHGVVLPSRGSSSKDKDKDKEGSETAETVLQKQRRIYENFQYLSHKEQATFESKFCAPKSAKQHQLSSVPWLALW